MDTVKKDLIDEINSIPVLKDYLDNIDEEGRLNLVKRNWKQILTNNTLYQDFQNNSSRMFRSNHTSNNNGMFKLQRVRERDNCFQVVLAAKCEIHREFGKDLVTKGKSLSIVIQCSEIMKMLTECLTKDLDSRYRIDDTVKMFFPVCDPQSCHYCRENKKKFLNHERKMYNRTYELHNPCILNTTVFNGKDIVHRFASLVDNVFQYQGHAILDLEINTRYFYENPCTPGVITKRLGGIVKKLLIFKESVVRPMKPIFVGDLNLVLPENSSTLEKEEKNKEETTCFEECQVPSTSRQKRALEEETNDQQIVEALPATYFENKKQRTMEDMFEVDIEEESVQLI